MTEAEKKAREEAEKQAKERCKGFLEKYLQSKGINTSRNWRCFEADTNPAHKTGDKNPSMGMIKANPINCTCGACKATYDIFKAVALFEFHTSEVTREVFEWVYDFCNVKVDDHTTQSNIRNNVTAQGRSEITEAAIDITEEVEAAHRELYTAAGKGYLDHLHQRGLTDEIIQVYKIGYDSKGFNHMLARYKQHRALIDKKGVDHSEGLYNSVIPIFDEQGRAVSFTSEISDRAKITQWNGKYLKPKGLTQSIFNERYLKANTPGIIFICEGIYDALSVEVAGGKAIALQGIGENRLKQICERYHPKTRFIIATDNDPAGKSAAERLKKTLFELGYPSIIKPAPQVLGQEKADYNDFLIHDRESFISFIGNSSKEEEFEPVVAELEKDLEAERAELEAECAANQLEGFLQRVEESSKRKGISTGFKNLDEALNGGLYEGLYVIGAISGAGKTAFTMQIADNIAAAGEDVLIFALEMSRDELIARSLSRISLLLDLEQNGSSKIARDHHSIRRGDIVGASQKRLTLAAAQKYRNEIGQHIFINEGVGDIDISFIKSKVKRHIKLKGRPPVLIVDYLQILAADEEDDLKRRTDKQIMDKAVLELKRLSRDHHIPIISISSFNRDNYSEPVNMASFKESGAIEYTATAVMGLQFPFMEYRKDNNGQWETDTYRKKRISEEVDKQKMAKKNGEPLMIECKMCKYRDGAEINTYFSFYPKFMYYKEAAAPTDNNTSGSNSFNKSAVDKTLEEFFNS